MSEEGVACRAAEGMMYMSEEDFLEAMDDYLWATVDKWKEQGIIITSVDKMSDFVDEEVARLIASTLSI